MGGDERPRGRVGAGRPTRRSATPSGAVGAARVAAEPGGAAALAALTRGAYVPEPGERVGVIVSGGNLDPADLA